ncbi:superoxide dismutase [Candidatus Gracilibacteria bacterium]|nr:superoxide dismutase [Candidatus Gracilibacteria bacterium]
MFTLTPLLYSLDALSPYISRETLEFHHGKHLQTYVDNLNKLIPGTEFESLTLEEIIQKAPAGGIFNNAAQIWNHVFYFESLAPHAIPTLSESFLTQIVDKWGSIEAFQIAFNDVALKTFGSGWAWLVKKSDGSLDIVSTSNAGTPITGSDIPLLTCDVWEHAYYIDYRNARAKYLENFWQVVNWEKVEERYRVG